MATVATGLEKFIDSPPEWIKGLRIGLLCNPASVNRRLRHARDLIAERFPGQLCALFGPQHGFLAEKQDNMIESDHMRDAELEIPIFSLYGETRQPTHQMFDCIDVLIVDLQDVGTRVYTFIYTMAHCMEAAAVFGKKVVVLDRPNPVGGIAVEGNCLQPDCTSFVGLYPIPMRHGLTIGEIARLFNDEYGIGCDLSVIPMHNWNRGMWFRDTGLPWVAPSPNLPTPEAAAVYPGQVIWEGTNVSEGRGTTQPFEIFGAPYLNPEKILEWMGAGRIGGLFLRKLAFEPTSNKWAGERCYGFQIHVTDHNRYTPFKTSLNLLQAMLHHHPDFFAWKAPPYEYETVRRPIDLIVGDKAILQRIESLEPIEQIERSWQADLAAFQQRSKCFHLYR